MEEGGQSQPMSERTSLRRQQKQLLREGLEVRRQKQLLREGSVW